MVALRPIAVTLFSGKVSRGRNGFPLGPLKALAVSGPQTVPGDYRHKGYRLFGNIAVGVELTQVPRFQRKRAPMGVFCPQIGAMPGYLVPRLASAQRPPIVAKLCNHSPKTKPARQVSPAGRRPPESVPSGVFGGGGGIRTPVPRASNDGLAVTCIEPSWVFKTTDSGLEFVRSGGE